MIYGKGISLNHDTICHGKFIFPHDIQCINRRKNMATRIVFGNADIDRETHLGVQERIGMKCPYTGKNMKYHCLGPCSDCVIDFAKVNFSSGIWVKKE